MGSRFEEELPLREPEKPEPAPAPAIEAESPALLPAPETRLTTATVLSLQRSAGNTAVTRLLTGQTAGSAAGEDDEGNDKKGKSVGAGARARLRGGAWTPRRGMATVSAAPLPLVQRAGLVPPAPGGAKDDSSLTQLVLQHLQAPVDYSLESKGGESTGYVKLNKASLKFSGKLSPSNTAPGDPVVGPGGGGKKTDDKNGFALSIAAEAKQKTRTELTKKLDDGVSSLIKSMTGQNNALKTELFAKAKAEAKGGASGGKKEFSTKVGFDFGVDATIFGVAKVTMQVKITLIGLKAKKGAKGFEFEATAFAAEPSQKVALKWPSAFTVQDIPFDLEGSAEWGAEFEPNWAKIAADAAADVGTEAAVMAAIDFALVAGPPLLAGFVLAVGIVAAGEKGALHANILEAAVDARSAAMVFAQCMTGSDIPGSGPRAKQAHDAAMGQIKTIASGSSMEVEELMTELRQNPASDFNRVYSQSRNQIYSSFDGEVRGTIIGWRKEHYIVSAFTTEADDIEEARRLYQPILQK